LYNIALYVVPHHSERKSKRSIVTFWPH
jgi:hypothetical protein